MGNNKILVEKTIASIKKRSNNCADDSWLNQRKNQFSSCIFKHPAYDRITLYIIKQSFKMTQVFTKTISLDEFFKFFQSRFTLITFFHNHPSHGVSPTFAVVNHYSTKLLMYFLPTDSINTMYFCNKKCRIILFSCDFYL